MNKQEEAIERLSSIKEDLLNSYPKQYLLTNDIFEIISEMLSVDYISISRGGKRINVFKDYMFSWVEKALENGGHKNYMMDLINIFKDITISDYLHGSFGNKSKELQSAIDGTYNELFAWQGLERCEWRRLERIKKMLNNIK